MTREGATHEINTKSKMESNMSAEKNRELEARDKRRAKKDTKLPWEREAGAGAEQAWADVDPLLISYVVSAVGGAGGSAQFTITQDGGALGLRIYHDDHKTKTRWYRLGEGLEEAMYEIADHYRGKMGEENERWS